MKCDIFVDITRMYQFCAVSEYSRMYVDRRKCFGLFLIVLGWLCFFDIGVHAEMSSKYGRPRRPKRLDWVTMLVFFCLIYMCACVIFLNVL